MPSDLQQYGTDTITQYDNRAKLIPNENKKWVDGLLNDVADTAVVHSTKLNEGMGECELAHASLLSPASTRERSTMMLCQNGSAS